jgi:colanic acid/amylovoran biosynthesis glycosyltransferase
MRIGYLVPEFPGQTHSFLWRELAALKKEGVEADLLSTRLPPANAIAHDWASEAMGRTTYLRSVPLSSPFRVLATIFRARPERLLKCLSVVFFSENAFHYFALFIVGAGLSNVARRHNWRHVHVHSCADSANIALFASLLSDVTYSLTLHGPLDQYGTNQLEKWRHARFAIVITRRIACQVRQSIEEDVLPPIYICPMGVDLHVFTRATPYVPHAGQGPLKIFSCGRLNPAKGHADLVEAIRLLRDRGIDARLEIAGEDDVNGCRADLKAQIEAAGLTEYVTLSGAVSEQHIVRSLTECHIFSLLSHAEPLGVALMEAMAMGIPTVATNAGGVPELITDGRDGVLVAPHDPEAAAAAIAKVAFDKKMAQKLGRAARSKIAGEFESKRSAEIIAREVFAHSGDKTLDATPES